MIIDRIALTGFGKFKDKVFHFSEGLNLVVGPNEAGKSTIQSAIFCGFFGTKSDGLFWGEPGVPCSVEIDYRVSGKSYKLTRDLAADKAILLEDGAEAARKSQLKKIVADHLGLGDERIFENTVFVRSDELKPLGKDGNIKVIKDRIEELLTGSRHVTVGQAVKTLNGVYVRVAGTKRQEGRGGQIGDISESLAVLDGEYEAAAREAAAVETGREKFAALDKEITDLENEAEELRPLLAAIAADRELKALAEKRRDVSIRIEAYEEGVKALDERRRDLESSRLAALPDDIAKSVRDWERELREITSMGERRQRLNDNKPPRSGINIPMTAAAALLIAASITVAFVASMAAGLILAAAALIILISAVRSASRTEPAVSDDSADTPGIEELEKRIAGVLKAAAAPDIDTFEREFTTWKQSRLQAEADSAALANSPDGQNIALLREEKRELLADEGKRESLIGDAVRLAMKEIDEVRVISGERRFKEINEALPSLREERSKMSGRMERDANRRDTGEIEDDRIFLRGRLDELRLKAEALKMASVVLSDVEKELADEVVPRISGRAAEYFRRFTGDSERFLSLGDDLELSFGEGVKNTEKFLSSGTRDQAFMALRLAITEMICGDGEPPLILDDPFRLFDAGRLSEMRRTIIELAAGQQVILFSHNELYRDWPGNVIEIGVEGRVKS